MEDLVSAYLDRLYEVVLADRQRIESTQWTLQRERIIGDAEAGSEHHFVGPPVRQADARREEFPAGGYPEMGGITSDSSQAQYVDGGIVHFELVHTVARDDGKVFPPHSQVCRELRRDLPAVAEVGPELGIFGSGLDELLTLL